MALGRVGRELFTFRVFYAAAKAYVRFKPDTEERSTYLYRAYTKWCEDNM